MQAEPRPVKGSRGLVRRSVVSRTPFIVWLSWTAGLISLALAVVTMRPGSPSVDPVTTLLMAAPAFSFVTVGALLVTRLPKQRIGWLLWLGGPASEISLGSGGLADRGLLAHPGSVPGAICFAALSQWTSPMIPRTSASTWPGISSSRSTDRGTGRPRLREVCVCSHASRRERHGDGRKARRTRGCGRSRRTCT